MSQEERYTAKSEYLHDAVVEQYEKRACYSGIIGRIRKRRESDAVVSAIQQFMNASVILDLPCGYGRWFDALKLRASTIIGIDISEKMLEGARKQNISSVNIQLHKGDAEKIPLRDSAVDCVFSFAFMKHLPDSVKCNVLGEFRRVSKGRIVVSFAVFNRFNRILWKLRGGNGYPNTPDQLREFCRLKGFKVGAVYRIGFPILGLEQLYVLEKQD